MTAHLSKSLPIFAQKTADNRYNLYNPEAKVSFSREILSINFASEKSLKTIRPAFAQASVGKKGGESLC